MSLFYIISFVRVSLLIVLFYFLFLYLLISLFVLYSHYFIILVYFYLFIYLPLFASILAPLSPASCTVQIPYWSAHVIADTTTLFLCNKTN
jgi:hypothetical protein